MCETDLFVVRLWDGFDYIWIDVSKPLPRDEAQEIWNEKTDGGSERASFKDTAYYKVFPADTRMLFAADRKWGQRDVDH